MMAPSVMVPIMPSPAVVPMPVTPTEMMPVATSPSEMMAMATTVSAPYQNDRAVSLFEAKRTWSCARESAGGKGRSAHTGERNKPSKNHFLHCILPLPLIEHPEKRGVSNWVPCRPLCVSALLQSPHLYIADVTRRNGQAPVEIVGLT